jgi:hypothetical protein
VGPRHFTCHNLSRDPILKEPIYQKYYVTSKNSYGLTNGVYLGLWNYGVHTFRYVDEAVRSGQN